MKAKTQAQLMAKEKPRNIQARFFETLEDLEREVQDLRGGVD